MKKKFLAFALTLALCLALLPVGAGAAEIIESGSCGENVTWTLDGDGVLTVSGTGAMTNYFLSYTIFSDGGASWSYKSDTWAYVPYRDQIRAVVVEEGVTAIGDGAFYEFERLASVTLAGSVERIGAMAFAYCTSLATLNVLGEVSIGERAFYQCGRLAVAMIPGGAGNPAPEASNNRGANEYDRAASAVDSYLYWDGERYLRVENVGGRVLLESYSADFRLLSSRYLDSDLSAVWGGFFAGEEFYFVITGRNNPDEDDGVAVVTVTKYDRDWNELGQASLYGENTTIPFRAGSLRCAEYGGMLYIHTSHQMYKSDDGRNHQSNMTFSVRESDMKVTFQRTGVSNISTGYVSHSFNQFILIDENGYIVTLDHGDAYPRSAVLQRYLVTAGKDYFMPLNSWQATDHIDIQTFPGAIGDNTTGASLGGLAETSAGYVTAFIYNGVGAESSGSVMGVATTDPSNVREVYLSYTQKNDFSDSCTTVRRITSYGDGGYRAGTPVLAPLGRDGGYVLWDVREGNGYGSYVSSGTIAYARYYADGSVGEIVTAGGALSDCQPIAVDGKVVWYVTDNAAPVFYTLDENGLTAYQTNPFLDVDEGDYYFDAVRWAYQTGVTVGKTETEFGPEDSVTRAQAVTFLWRAVGEPEPEHTGNPYYDVSRGDYYYGAVLWAAENGITLGTDENHFSPGQTCSSAHIVTFLYRTLGIGENGWYAEAADWAAREGLLDGTGLSVSPDENCPRADVVTFLFRELGLR